MEKILQEDIDKLITRKQNEGYILGETFGFEFGPDAPVPDPECKEPASRMWYIPADPVWKGEKMRPWLYAYLYGQ